MLDNLVLLCYDIAKLSASLTDKPSKITGGGEGANGRIRDSFNNRNRACLLFAWIRRQGIGGIIEKAK